MNDNKKTPQVLNSEVEGNRCALTIRAPLDCIWFDGHFEGAPILSGVAQIDWIMILANQYLQLNREFMGVDVLKFQQVIRPGDELNLELEWVSEKNQLRFTLFAEKPVSSGRIALSPEATS